MSPHENPERKLADFTTWFKQNGGTLHSGVEFAHSPSKGVHLRRKPSESDAPALSPGEAILTCPHCITFSALNAVNLLPSHGFSSESASEPVPRVARLPQPVIESAPRPQALAAVWLAVHAQLGRGSFWAPYIDILPRNPGCASNSGPLEAEHLPGIGTVDTPLWWSEEERRAFRGSPLERGVQDLEGIWRRDWEHWGTRVGKWAAGLGIHLDWTWYAWALTILSSRAFSSSQLEGFSDPSYNKPYLSIYNPDVVLYPGLDMLNHDPGTKNYWISEADKTTFYYEGGSEPGDEICMSYGPKNNGQLLLSFGFSIDSQDFNHDAFPLRRTVEPFADRFSVVPFFNFVPQRRHQKGVLVKQPQQHPPDCDDSFRVFYIRSKCFYEGYVSETDTEIGTMQRAFVGIPLALIADLCPFLASPVKMEEVEHTIKSAVDFRLSNLTDIYNLFGIRTVASVANVLQQRLVGDLGQLPDSSASDTTHTPPITVSGPVHDDRFHMSSVYIESQRQILSQATQQLNYWLLNSICHVPQERRPYKLLTLSAAFFRVSRVSWGALFYAFATNKFLVAKNVRSAGQGDAPNSALRKAQVHGRGSQAEAAQRDGTWNAIRPREEEIVDWVICLGTLLNSDEEPLAGMESAEEATPDQDFRAYGEGLVIESLQHWAQTTYELYRTSSAGRGVRFTSEEADDVQALVEYMRLQHSQRCPPVYPNPWEPSNWPRSRIIILLQMIRGEAIELAIPTRNISNYPRQVPEEFSACHTSSDGVIHALAIGIPCEAEYPAYEGGEETLEPMFDAPSWSEFNHSFG